MKTPGRPLVPGTNSNPIGPFNYILMEFGSFIQLVSYISPPKLCIEPQSSVVLVILFSPFYLLFLPTCCSLFYQAAGALSTSRATIYRRNQPFISSKIPVNARRARRTMTLKLFPRKHGFLGEFGSL
jgi:hypothetical protein